MRALLVFSLVIVSASSLTCPSDYQMEDGIGCVRFLYDRIYASVDQLLLASREECGKDGAHLPIIMNGQVDKKFNNLINSRPDHDGVDLILDIVCNPNTKRLEWINGANIAYAPYLLYPVDVLDFDCVSTQDTVCSQPSGEIWYVIHAPYGHPSTVLCVYDGLEITTTGPVTATTPLSISTAQPTKQPASAECGDYSLMPNAEHSKEPCFKLFTTPLSWQSAQAQCAADLGSLVTINSADENNFFRRTAVSGGLLDGIHIGAHQSTANLGQWTWVDGEVPFDGKAYDNFASYFPIPGAGECVAMLTDATSAQWINEDCTDNEIPFICRRAASISIPTTCPTDPPKPNEDFFSPGYPDALVSCDYMLFVAAKKLVQLEITSLATDGSKDYLEIFEGPAGSNLIANVTGPIVIPTDFTTAKSNVMRVNWKTNGSGSGRGFRMRYYYEVDPSSQ